MSATTCGAIVITDLDGTLLDHHNYDWHPAMPALNALHERGVPVVFNTSKTLEESRQLQREIGITGPVIVENGSCIATAEGETVLGRPRAAICAWLDASVSHRRYKFQSFSELGVDGIVRTTGLDEARAAKAAQRAWSEPLLWEDSDAALQDFAADAAQAGLHLLRGGRFVHVLGDCDKGRASQALVAQMDAEVPPRIVALGDSPNDLAMLEVADRAFWVRSPVAEPPYAGQHPAAARVTRETGPRGWNEAIAALLEEGYFNE